MKKFWISFVLCMSILLNLPVLEVSAKNKPLRAPDGVLVIEGMSNAATDGDKIYYSIDGQEVGCYSIKKKKNLNEKLSVMVKDRYDRHEYEKHFSYFSVQGEYLYGMTEFSSGPGIYKNGGIYRRKKNGKQFFKLAEGISFIVSGKHIYYVKLEGLYDGDGEDDWKGNSIWKMDLDGKNKKRIKYIKGDGILLSLYKSNKNIYYKNLYYDFKLFSLDGKRIKEKYYYSNYGRFSRLIESTDNFYLKETKKRIDDKNNIKVGGFKKGNWKYKTLLEYKDDTYISLVLGVNKYIIIIKHSPNEEGDRIELYDINGKFIKTLKKGVFFAA